MQDIVNKAKQIKLLIFDVDGVLTDGRLYFSNSGDEYKAFHAHDGFGIKMLMATGVEVAVITSRTSAIVTHRMKDLGLTHLYQGQQDKKNAYQTLKTKLNLEDNHIAFVGDDIIDLPLIRRAGLGVATANAVATVTQYADWQTKKEGGQGAAREVCELIMKAQNTFADIIEKYSD